MVELPHTGAGAAAVTASESQVNNPFAAVRQVRLKRHGSQPHGSTNATGGSESW